MYKVTLAMPVYNVEKYIERALNSALNQTFESIEYILVDDRGTDNSINIAKEIIKNHPKGKDVRIIDHGVNRSTGATKNTAIDNAQGEYLYFMDSDDEITPDCISFLYAKMMETPVDFVAASYQEISPTEQITKVLYQNETINRDEYAVARAVYLKNNNIHIPTWNKLYDLNFLRLNNVRCISNHSIEDPVFTFQVILNAQSCRLSSKITYYYYKIENSNTNKINKSFTPKFAKQHEEIIIYQKAYSQNYLIYDFYPAIIKQIYSRIRWVSLCIYKSPFIPIKEKRNYIAVILKYPRPFKDVICTNNISIWILFLISRIPFPLWALLCKKLLLL
jgi:glycosyltransferase involved in cell wall biosynthesis